MPESSKVIYKSPHKENPSAYVRCLDRAKSKDTAIMEEFSRLRSDLLQSFPDCSPGAVIQSKRGTHMIVIEAYYLLLFNEDPAQIKLEMIVYTPDSHSPKEIADKFTHGYTVFELHSRYKMGGAQEEVYKDSIERFARMHSLKQTNHEK